MNTMQKMTWKNFQITFPTEEDCLEEIVKNLNEIGWIFLCTRCSSKAIRRNRGERRYHCMDCHYKGWILAGTNFEFMRKARLWLGFIWFLEHGVQINAWQFHKLAKCAYSSALMILRKLGSVLYENLESAQGADLADSGEFLSIFWKRSNQTPIGEHPSLEQEYFHQMLKSQTADESSERENFETIVELNENENKDEDEIATKDLQGEVAQILQLISDQKIHLDQICQLTGLYCGDVIAILISLELDDQVERHGGDYYTLKKKKSEKMKNEKMKNRSEQSSWAITQLKIDAFKTFITSQIHGISRKYLQFYLAIFWCNVDRKRWSSSELLKACCRSTFKSSRDLFQFVTQACVLVM